MEPLVIPHQRTCQCKPCKSNCLSAKEWMKSQVPIWEFAYNKEDLAAKKIHPAIFPSGLASKVISMFTHEGELVLDPFAGTGTTLLAGYNLKRNVIGSDLNQDYIDFARQRLAQAKANLFDASNTTQQQMILDDCRNVHKVIAPNTVKLVFTSPPYANMLGSARKNKSRMDKSKMKDQAVKIDPYLTDPRNFGKLDIEAFCKDMGALFQSLRPCLTSNANVVINITHSIWKDNKRYELFSPLKSEMEKAGYEWRNTMIWNRCNLVNKVGIFGYPNNYIVLSSCYELLLHFRVQP